MRLYLRFLYFLKPHWKLVLFAISSMLITIVMTFTDPLITKHIIDQILLPAVQQKSESQNPLFALYTFASLLALVFLVENFAGFLYRYFWTFAELATIHDFRNKIYLTIKTIPDDFLKEKGIGDIMSRNIADVESTSSFFRVLINSVRNIVSIAGIITILFWQDWKIAVLCIVVALFLIPIVLRLASAIRRDFLLALDARGILNHFLFGKLIPSEPDGTLVINQSEEAKIFNNKSEMFKQHNVNIGKLFAMLFAMTGFVIATTSVIIWIYGGRQILDGQLTIGTLTLLLQYSSRFGESVKNLGQNYGIIQRLNAPLQRIFEVINLMDLEKS